jgi:hypothetical protein
VEIGTLEETMEYNKRNRRAGKEEKIQTKKT